MSLPEFEVLVDLARHDPNGLEDLRTALVTGVIDGARTPQQQQRLAGLQFRIDLERRKSSSPMGATIRISEMMCRSLADLHLSIVAPEELDGEGEEIELQDVGATIVPFPKPLNLHKNGPEAAVPAPEAKTEVVVELTPANDD